MSRAVWSGSLSCGLMNIPIEVYPATKDRTISLNLIHSKCSTPLKYKRWCPKCEEEIGWGEIDRGYRLVKDKVIVLKREELERLRLKTIKSVDIQCFVDLTSIDPIFFASHYYIAPREGGEKAYSLLRGVLSITNRAGVGKVVIHNKEHVVAIRPYQRGLVMTMLHYPDEVLEIGKLEKIEDLPLPGERELELGKILIERMSDDFKPEEYVDTYREAVMELIKQKAEGIEIPAAKPTEVKATVDLMKALEASIKVAAKEKAAQSR